MVKPPTQDAHSCMEQFFQFLELNVKNRVAAKIGANQTLDMGGLSNINQQAAASHRNKTKSVITSAKTRAADVAVDIAPEQRRKLRDTFIFYCAWGEKHNYLYMSRSQFIKFARDCRLTGPGGWDSVGLSILFEKIHRDSADPSPGVRFGLIDWLHALLTISTRIFQDVSGQEAFDKVVSERILEGSGVAVRTTDDPLSAVLLHPDVLDMLGAASGPLEPVYKYYVSDQDFINLDKSGATLWDIQEARSHLPFQSFINFAQDFQLLPALLTRLQLSSAFKLAKFGNEDKANKSVLDDTARLSFQEFMDAIGRCALMAYNYQVPAVAAPTLSFANSYHPQAKALWQAESEQNQRDSFNFPDEISLPSAKGTGSSSSSDCGDDDGPGGWRRSDVTTAAAARGRTSGVGGGPRTAMNASTTNTLVVHRPSATAGGAGAESMTLAIHDEITTLPTLAKPVHLEQFSNDWVGRPPSPPSEAPVMRIGMESKGAKPDAREAGFEGKMASMLDARVVREQHMAMLQLQYQVERREQMQGAHKDSVDRRQQLQAAAGQPQGAPASLMQWSLPTRPAPGKTSKQPPARPIPSGTLLKELQAVAEVKRQ